MKRKIPPRNPRAAHCRKILAARRVGSGAKCACGESRPEAFISKRRPVVCAKCERKSRGHSDVDNHHCFGRANSPLTIPVLVNEHRAALSTRQHDWPSRTLENPNRSPLLAGAAHLRGFADTVSYLMREALLPTADLLERLDTTNKKKRSKNAGIRKKLKAFEPKI